MNNNAGGQGSRTQVIVELGTDYIAMMQFESGGRVPALAKLHIEPHAGEEDLAVRVGRAFKSGKFANVPVIGMIPLHLATVRIVDLPSTDADEIENMVDLQVPKQTPYSVDEILYEYRAIGEDRGGYSRIVLGIVKRDVIRQRYHLLEAAGLRIGRMTLGVEGVLSWAASLSGAESLASGSQIVVDVGAEGSGVFVFKDADLIFARSVRIGSLKLNEDDDTATALVDEIRRSLDACHGEHPDLEWSRIMVAGAPRIEDALIARLGAELGIPALGLDVHGSLKRIPPRIAMQEAPVGNVSLCAALGAALAPGSLGFDFVPESVALRKGMTARARTFSAFGLLLMTVFVAVSCGAMMNLAVSAERLRRLEARADEKRSEARLLMDRHAISLAAAQRQDVKNAAVAVLAELNGMLPASVYLDRFEYSTDGGDSYALVIAGHGLSDDVNDFEHSLTRSGAFKEVRSRGKTKVNRDQDLYTFEIACRVEVLSE